MKVKHILAYFTLTLLLTLWGMAWSDSDISSKMMIDGINAMVAQAVSCLNECSIPSCRLCSGINQQTCLGVGYGDGRSSGIRCPNLHRRAWPLLPASAWGCSRLADGYDHRTTATFFTPLKSRDRRDCGVKLKSSGSGREASHRYSRSTGRDQGREATNVPRMPEFDSPVPELTIYHIQAQMWVESRGDWRAISNKNCQGPMQVMPATGREHGYPEWSLTHPVLGMEAGIAIMSKLWTRFENVSMRSRFVTTSCDVRRNILRNQRWELALSAYNCGLSRTLRALRSGREWQKDIPNETRHYIQRVMRRYYGR